MSVLSLFKRSFSLGIHIIAETPFKKTSYLFSYKGMYSRISKILEKAFTYPLSFSFPPTLALIEFSKLPFFFFFFFLKLVLKLVILPVFSCFGFLCLLSSYFGWHVSLFLQLLVGLLRMKWILVSHQPCSRNKWRHWTCRWKRGTGGNRRYG